jgi:hypothetical protein
MNRGMYNANNGVIGNIWRQKVSASAKQGTHPAPGLDEDVYNLFDSWSWDLPDNADDINNFIINLKCELGIQQLKDVFDCFYITAAATQSKSYTNWAQPGTYDLTLDNATGMVFTPLKGWRSTANTSAGYINTNFNPWQTICNYNNKTELWSVGNTQSLYDYGGSLGFYVTDRPNAIYQGGFTYDIGAHFGANGTGISIALTTQAIALQYAILQIRNSIPLAQNPCYPGNVANNNDTDVVQRQYNLYPFYSIVKNDYNTTGFYINGDLKHTNTNNVFSTTSTTNLGTASAPGPIIFPNINVSTTGGVTKITNSNAVRQFGFIFIGSRNIDQTILYNNINNYLTSIDAAIPNS